MAETFKEGDTRMGSFYPKNCVVAVLPNADRAAEARVELMRHGFAADDVKVWERDELFRTEETFTQDRNLLEKFGALHSDEENWMNEYREFLEEGASLITIYAPDSGRLEEIQGVLLPFGAGRMRHYGAMVVSDLVPGKAPEY